MQVEDLLDLDHALAAVFVLVALLALLLTGVLSSPAALLPLSPRLGRAVGAAAGRVFKATRPMELAGRNQAMNNNTFTEANVGL